MATPSALGEGSGEAGEEGESQFECNICFEQASEAVVSLCGHLFCWPCIHRWMESRPTNPTCPVCKSVIDVERLIPLYGRGSSENKDPRQRLPPRPRGQREDAEHNNAQQAANGFDGIQVSFGIGAFPFAMFGGVFGNGGRVQRGLNNQPLNPEQREQERKLARFFLFVALLVFIFIVIS